MQPQCVSHSSPRFPGGLRRTPRPAFADIREVWTNHFDRVLNGFLDELRQRVVVVLSEFLPAVLALVAVEVDVDTAFFDRIGLPDTR